MNEQVEEFFLHYERSNASSDVTAIGHLYADTFMFGGPKGVQAVKKADFLNIVPRMKARVSSMGVLGTRLKTVHVRELDSKYCLATVQWQITFRDPSAIRPLDLSASYILVQEEGALAIVFQIDHQDLQATLHTAQEGEPSSGSTHIRE